MKLINGAHYEQLEIRAMKTVDTLGDRMKSYEEIERKFLTPRTPIISHVYSRIG